MIPGVTGVMSAPQRQLSDPSENPSESGTNPSGEDASQQYDPLSSNQAINPSCEYSVSGCEVVSRLSPGADSTVGLLSGLEELRNSVMATLLSDSQKRRSVTFAKGVTNALVSWRDLSDTTGVSLNQFWLIFTDDLYESLYAAEIAEQLRFSSLLAYVFIFMNGLYALFGRSMMIGEWGSSSHKVHNVAWFVLLISTLVVISVQVARLTVLRRRCGGRDMNFEPIVAIFLSVCIWVRCLLGERTTVAHMLGQDPEEVFGLSECDSGDLVLMIQTCVGMLYLCLFTHMRFKWLLLPGVSVGVAFALAIFIGADAGNAMLGAFGISTCQALLLVFAFVGQRQIEFTRRRAFVLKVEAETQRVALEKEKEFSKHKMQKLAKLKSSQMSLFKEVKKAYEKKRRTKSKSRSDSDCSRDGIPEEEFQSPVLPWSPELTPDAEEAYNNLIDYPELAGTPLAEAMPPHATTDWNALNRAVERMRDPLYPLRDYHNDMLASFPELGLYTFGSEDSHDMTSTEKMSSGRSRLEELSRTIGALYAVYWLMRVDLDGKRGFCFGYSDAWEPEPQCEGPAPSDLLGLNFFKMSPEERKLNFYYHFTWDHCQRLLESAGLFKLDDKKRIMENSINPVRLRALLVLTAIHDVMKNGFICPTVHTAHAPYHEYKAGDVIRDHDRALDYVLTYYGNLFPSYRGLDEESQKVIKFTQGKMGFNNGWLVQGEAPPGALFATFKELIDSGGANSNDVAFYFAHWVTDLAGAEALPLRGAVKFVQRFPQFVLESFFRSFPYVWKLSDRSESEVFQEYLCARWYEDSKLGALPTGENSVAIMRLGLMVQSHADEVIPAFDKLYPQDRKVLQEELTRTGLVGQNYTGVTPLSGYPAILVYYSPAFLQNNFEQLVEALQLLAQIFRLGRQLFPLRYDEEVKADHRDAVHTHTQDQHTALIRIEVVKDMKVHDLNAYRQGAELRNLEGYFLVKQGPLEAIVEKHPMSAINNLVASGKEFKFLM